MKWCSELRRHQGREGMWKRQELVQGSPGPVEQWVLGISGARAFLATWSKEKLSERLKLVCKSQEKWFWCLQYFVCGIVVVAFLSVAFRVCHNFVAWNQCYWLGTWEIKRPTTNDPDRPTSGKASTVRKLQGSFQAFSVACLHPWPLELVPDQLLRTHYWVKQCPGCNSDWAFDKGF